MPSPATAATATDEDLDQDADQDDDATTDPNADPEEETGDAEDGEGDTADEVVVQIGDEPPPGSDEEEEQDVTAKPWVRELRAKQRDLVRENRELRAERDKRAPEPEKAPEIGDKPTLEASDFDADKFERDLLAWNQRKADAEGARQKREKDAKDADDAWKARLADHEKAAKALKVRDYADVEEEVRSALSIVQQGIVIKGAGNSALLVYAMGKNPAKLKELAAITDPVTFAFAVAKLETQVKVTPRSKQTPPPEGRVRGSAPGSGAVDNTRARLEKEADRTGDRTKVAAYIREQNQKKRA